MQDLHSIRFNCGFARGAVRELSTQNVNREERKNKFQELFPHYGVSSSYFESSNGRLSNFDKHCKSILEAWRKRWHPTSSRTDYETTLCTSKWEALSQLEKEKHTLAGCNECSTNFQDLQRKFPLKPDHVAPSVLSFNTQVLDKLGTKTATKKALQELNERFTDTFEASFTDSLIQHGGENLQVYH